MPAETGDAEPPPQDVEQELERLRSEYATRRELHSAELLAVYRKACVHACLGSPL